MRQVFTTGQVAKVCKVAPRTVSKWIDSGRLKGYRIPGSMDRRVPRENLIRFLKDHGMPLGELETEQLHQVLLVGTDERSAAHFRDHLAESAGFRVEVARDAFEAGLMVASTRRDSIIVDLSMGRSECTRLVARLRKNEAFARTYIAGIAAEDEADPQSLVPFGFTDVFKQPFDLAEIAARVTYVRASLEADL